MQPTSKQEHGSDTSPPAVPAAAGLVGRLLAEAASGRPLAEFDLAHGSGGGDSHALSQQLQWAVRGGLGAALLAAAQRAATALPPGWSDTLQSADLSARHRHAGFVAATLELLDVCQRLGVPVTLLKGISTSDQFYPEPHLRPMADVDVLIDAKDYDRTEAALLSSGFKLSAEPEWPDLQHGVPLLHGAEGTLVELHTRLFRADSPLQSGSLFRAAALALRTCDFRFHGRPVRRLELEMQLAYAAASWVNDLVNVGLEPSFMATLFDVAYLLRRHGDRIDWDRLSRRADNPMASASLYLVLTYLARFGAEGIPASTLRHFAIGQRLLGPLQLPLVHHVLDRHLLAGRPWRWPLPPPLPARYALRHQIVKRIVEPLSRRVGRQRGRG